MKITAVLTGLKTPLKLNGFINGRSVTIKRDNPDDKQHLALIVQQDIIIVQKKYHLSMSR